MVSTIGAKNLAERQKPFIRHLRIKGPRGEGKSDAARAVVLKTPNDGGLDGARILELTPTDAIKEQLKANTQAAAGRGVFGVPTFFVGDEMFFGKDRTLQVEEELRK